MFLKTRSIYFISLFSFLPSLCSNSARKSASKSLVIEEEEKEINDLGEEDTKDQRKHAIGEVCL